MFPTIKNYSNPPSLNSPSGHVRKLSHVQFGKRPYNLQDKYASSTLMIPFDEQQQKQQQFNQSEIKDSNIEITTKSNCSMTDIMSQEGEEGQMKLISNTNNNQQKKYNRFISWFYTTKNIGPFIKGEHWPLFTYLVFAFTIIIFSGQMILSKQSSGEFFELEPLNYMLGPSMEIMIQSGARFPPCMRKVDSMPSDQRYICLHTLLYKNSLTPLAVAATTNRTLLSSFSDQPLILLDPVANLTDPGLLNLTCSLSTICGMSSFYQYRVPDQTYRLLTPLFVHTGLIHLFINMFALLVLGVKIERTINSLRFTLLYIGSGMFGHALGANLAPPTTPFLGCSSSLLGLIGFLYADLILNWKLLEKPFSNLFKLVLCTGILFLIGLLPGVDTFSHIGGLIGGLLLGFFIISVKYWPKLPKYKNKRIPLFYSLKLISGCIFGLLIALLIHQFSTSKLDQVCPYCRYISCLPFNGFCD